MLHRIRLSALFPAIVLLLGGFAVSRATLKACSAPLAALSRSALSGSELSPSDAAVDLQAPGKNAPAKHPQRGGDGEKRPAGAQLPADRPASRSTSESSPQSTPVHVAAESSGATILNGPFAPHLCGSSGALLPPPRLRPPADASLPSRRAPDPSNVCAWTRTPPGCPTRGPPAVTR